MNIEQVEGYKQDIIAFLKDGKNWNEQQKMVLDIGIDLLDDFFEEMKACADDK
jgi:uncharacterized phage-like protein YoqJ